MTTRDGFDKQSWIEEGARHLRSAKILRDSRKRRRAAHAKMTQATGHRKRIDNIRAMEAAVHSSVLLVSYAIELFLKAGLTRLYIGCSTELFERDVKRYGHNLCKLARKVEYSLSSTTKRQLKELETVIRSEGRYPFLSENTRAHIERVNNRAARFWSDKQFNQYQRLARRIRKHAMKLDGDSDNPASYSSVRIDSDGYFVFRCGGNLSPRITVKYSTHQRSTKANSKRALKRLVTAHLVDPLIKHFWDSAHYRCVKI